MRKFQLDSVRFCSFNKKWYFHTGRQIDGSFIYFKNKKTADNFQRYASKFTLTMFIQSNQVYSEVYSIYRSIYFQFDWHSLEQKKIISIIYNINYQFDRWTNYKTISESNSNFIFLAPTKIQNSIIEIIEILRIFVKKSSNTSMVYILDSKLTYLKFLKNQFLEFDKITNDTCDYKKIVNLPIMRIVAS